MDNKFNSTSLLRIFLGLIFLSAGVGRVFNWQIVIPELHQFGLDSVYISIFIIALEIICGLLLIFNIKPKKVLLVFITLLTVVLIWALLVAGKSLIGNASELFTFHLTPSNFFLHFTYLVILVYLLGEKEI